jgi:hypothetical protein
VKSGEYAHVEHDGYFHTWPLRRYQSRTVRKWNFQTSLSTTLRTYMHFRAFRSILPLLLTALIPSDTVFAEHYEVVFSTYLGGTGRQDTARAVAMDADGNSYLAGGTSSADFPTTPGTYNRKYFGDGRSLGSHGPMDVFVTKFDPQGHLVWSTLLGGPNYDRAYTVRVDKLGFVYVGGRAGEGFPTTPGTVQPEFEGDDKLNGAYGKQDGFLTKLSPDGSRIIWSTYFGTPGKAIIRDFDLDNDGNIYLVMIEHEGTCRHVTRGAFQEQPAGGMDNIVAKITADGKEVVWCSFIGGTGRDLAPSIRVGQDRRPVVAGSTFSTDFPVTDRCFQRQLRGQEDAFVAKFNADGSSLVFATLIGGSGEDGGAGKHGLALDRIGRACVTGHTFSSDFPVTPKAFQSRYGGGPSGDWRQRGDRFFAIVAADGSRLDAATLLGGGANDGGEGVEIDSEGRIYSSGATFSTDFIATTDAWQKSYAGAAKPHHQLWGGGDGTVTVLSAELSGVEFSTYMGGSGEDLFRAIAVSPKGEIVLAGSTTSTDFPTVNAYQPAAAGGLDEVIVVKLRRANPTKK